jgi:hypothetical protein
MRYDITLALPTCGRLPLFRRTMDSFLKNVKDANRIDKYLLVDNGSSDSDINDMQREYPIFAGNVLDTRGQEYRDMRKHLYRAIETKYVFLIEDDWLFYRNARYIEPAMKIMEHDSKIKEVTFRYFPCPVVSTTCGLHYRLHEYLGKRGPYPDAYDCHWYGFTHNPSIQIVSCVLQAYPILVGRVETRVGEYWMRHGYKVAHTLQGHVRHMGHDQSAFDITGHKR